MPRKLSDSLGDQRPARALELLHRIDKRGSDEHRCMRHHKQRDGNKILTHRTQLARHKQPRQPVRQVGGLDRRLTSMTS